MADRCAAELCPYWPGEGCVRAFAPCDEVENRPLSIGMFAGGADRYFEIPDEDMMMAADPSPGGGLDTWDF